MRDTQIVNAIAAYINGVWDDPDLAQLGELSELPLQNIQRLIDLGSKQSIEARSVVFASTAHVTDTTRDLLNEWGEIAARHHRTNTIPPAHIAATVYGWFIYCDEEPETTDFPSDLIHLMKRVRELGCEYVCLDRDAEPIEGLPTYTWDVQNAVAEVLDR